MSRDLSKIIPDLTKQFNLSSKASWIKTYQGMDELIDLFHENVRLCDRAYTEWMWLGNDDKLVYLYGEIYFQQLIKNRVKNKTPIKILNCRPANFYAIKKDFDEREYRQMKFLPKEYESDTSISIVNNIVTHWNPISLKAVVIEDGLIADQYRGIFNLLWEVL